MPSGLPLIYATVAEEEGRHHRHSERERVHSPPPLSSSFSAFSIIPSQGLGGATGIDGERESEPRSSPIICNGQLGHTSSMQWQIFGTNRRRRRRDMIKHCGDVASLALPLSLSLLSLSLTVSPCLMRPRNPFLGADAFASLLLLFLPFSSDALPSPLGGGRISSSSPFLLPSLEWKIHSCCGLSPPPPPPPIALESSAGGQGGEGAGKGG